MNDSTAARRHTLHAGLWLAVIAIAAVLALLVRRGLQSGFDWGLFATTMKSASWTWLFAGWALAVLSYWGRAGRWLVMLRPLAPSAKSWTLFCDTAIGYSALTLLGRAGEIVRPWLIAQSNRVPVSSQISAWVLERVYDTLIVLGFFGFALLSTTDDGRIAHPAARWILDAGGASLGIFALLCLTALIALHGVPETLERRLQSVVALLPENRREAIARFVQSMLSTLRAANSWSAVLRLLGWSVVEWLILVLTYASIFKAFPETHNLTTIEILAFMGFASFGSIVQVPGLGGGVQLVSILVLTEFFKIPLAASTGIALVTWFVSFVGIMPVGLILALRRGLTWAQIRSASKELSS